MNSKRLFHQLMFLHDQPQFLIREELRKIVQALIQNPYLGDILSQWVGLEVERQ